MKSEGGGRERKEKERIQRRKEEEEEQGKGKTEREREETLYRRNTLYSPSTKGLSRGFKPLRTVYVMRLHIHCKPCLMERERENGKKKMQNDKFLKTVCYLSRPLN